MNSKNFFSQIVSLLLNRQQKSSFFAIFSAVFIFLLCCCFVLRSPTPEKIEKLSADQNFTDEINAKVAWLDNSYLSLIPGSSKIYQSIADKFLSPEQLNTKSTSNIIKFLDLGDLVHSIKNNTAQLILKFIFISIAFAPFWIASIILGILYWKKVFPVKTANHLLKLFSKEDSPYYTGIYAKLKVDEDRNVSCFCPGLTAPRLEKIELALTQPLTQQLREFEAFNDTNLSLVQIILAYPDYPGDIYQDDFSDNRLTLINSA
ncbi:MAG: hypothetical protein KBC84_06295, partial [Proteobacteria bacterium]|nr:hypothetical protein [Pseudomonadota bacterium]